MTNESTVEICKRKLVEKKAELLNRMNEAKKDYLELDKGTDEGDQSMSNFAESTFLMSQERSRKNLFEIELALQRIENGCYGICEETQEPIEEDRLMAIPWTRLSIEGAELKESINKRFAVVSSRT